jgi:hypothetical protein
MIIGLSGYAQSGKDTVAKILVEDYEFKRVAFADNIRKLLLETNPLVGDAPEGPTYLKDFVNKFGWDEAKQDPEVRRLLQEFGVGARNVFGEFFWVDKALERIDFRDRIVITDVRFKNEADTIRSLGGDIWRVVREDVYAVNNHVSETDLNGYPFTAHVNNDTTIEALELQVAFLYKAAYERQLWNANN